MRACHGVFPAEAVLECRLTSRRGVGRCLRFMPWSGDVLAAYEAAVWLLHEVGQRATMWPTDKRHELRAQGRRQLAPAAVDGDALDRTPSDLVEPVVVATFVRPVHTYPWLRR